MARATWSIALPEGRHEIAATHGFWLGKTTIRVDGPVVRSIRTMLAMSADMGVDLPIDVDGHGVVISVRPVTVGRVIVIGYRFGLSIDGTAVSAADALPPVRPGSNPMARGWPTQGPRLIEALAWASVGGAFIGLYQHGENPFAVLYLAAPAACSVITRRTSFPTWLLGLVCLAIVVAGMVTVALIGALAKR